MSLPKVHEILASVFWVGLVSCLPFQSGQAAPSDDPHPRVPIAMLRTQGEPVRMTPSQIHNIQVSTYT